MSFLGEVTSSVNSVISQFGGNFTNGGAWGELNSNHFVTIQEVSNILTGNIYPNNGDSVTGRLVSYSVSDNQNWESPFEDQNLDKSGGGKMMQTIAFLQSGQISKVLKNEDGSEAEGGNAKAKALLEAFSGKSLQVVMQSLQNWGGSQPMTVTLDIEFKAFTNAHADVTLPLLKLQRMQYPQLADNIVDAAKKAKDSFDAAMNGKTYDDVLKAIESLPSSTPKAVSVSFLSTTYNMVYVIDGVNVNADSIKIDKDGDYIQQTVQVTLKSKYAMQKDNVKFPSIQNSRGARSR